MKIILIVVSIVFVIMLVCSGIIYFQNDSSDRNVNVENPMDEDIYSGSGSMDLGVARENGLTPGSYTFRCSVGKKGGDKSYPVKVEITIDNYNNITGRYSFDSTIRKYGDVSSSYFYITGQYEENEAIAYMDIKMYGKSDIFEKWTLFLVTGDGYGSVNGSGEFTNMNTDEVYIVDVL